MPAQEVGEAYVAIRATAAGFAQQARAEVNQALAGVRESANVNIRARVDESGSRAVAQSFQPVIGGAQQMGSEVEKSYGQVSGASHHAYERVSVDHGGIRQRFSETAKAASAMGGGILLAYGAFNQGRQAITVANELAHSTVVLSQATGLNAHQASAWISIAQSQGIASTTLQTSFNSLSKATSGATDAFAKASDTQKVAIERVHTEQQRVNADNLAYNAAIAKYGDGTKQAASALATLSSAQASLKDYQDKTTLSLSGQAAAFAALGISQQQLQAVQGNLPAELDLISAKMQSLGAGTDRSTIAQQLFGRGYAQLLPLLDQGPKAINANIDTATKYGATLSGPTLKSMEALRKEQGQLNLQVEGLRVQFATHLEPVLIDVAKKTLDLAQGGVSVLTNAWDRAKGAADRFLQTPYGQGLSTIAGDAIRFADQVRAKFVGDLTKPLDFGHLFTHFTTDLTTALPKMARDFWTQLNQDLFATGAPVRVRVPVQVQTEHQAANVPPQIAGAGIFPGSGFEEQGKKLGTSVVDGMISGLKAAFKGGSDIGHIVGEAFQDGIQWVVQGGGAQRIVSGALQIADAFLKVLFDPSFWISNWKVILDLAITLFPYDKILIIPGRILEALGLGGFAARVAEKLAGPLISAVEALPTRIGFAISDLGGFIADGLLSTAPRIGERFTAGLADVIRQGFDKFGGYLADTIPKLVSALFTDLSGSIDKGSSALFDRVIGLFEGGLINRLFGLFARFVANATIIGFAQEIGAQVLHGILSGLESGADWLIGQISGLIHHALIDPIERILGIASPSTLAAQWGKDIILGLVNGLKGLPVIGAVFRVEFAIVGAVVKAGMRYIRGVFDAEVNWVKSWANLIGDLLHGRWGKIMGDLDGIIHAGIRLANAILGGLPQDILNNAGRVASAAMRLGGRLVTGVIDEAKRLPGRVVGLIHDVGDKLASLGTWLYNQAKHLAGRLVSGVIDNITGLGSSLKNKAESLIGGALSSLNPFSPIEHGADIYIARPIIQGTVDALDPFHDRLQTAIIDPLVKVTNQAQNTGQSQGRQMGQGITSGVRAGLNPLAGMLTSAIVGASNTAINAAKRALGISSPSTVYAEQIGKPLADGIVHGMGGLETALAKKVTDAAQAATRAAGGFGGGITPQGGAAIGANQTLGRQMMLAAGWGADQWGALQALWTRESGWNANAVNPSSGAYGIPQSLGHGHPYNLGDARAQIAWGLDYIRGRYGSPGAAWAHETAVGWYHGGGVVPGSPTQSVPAMLRGQEVVFTPEQMKMLAGRGGVHVDNLTIVEAQNPYATAEAFLNEIASRV